MSQSAAAEARPVPELHEAAVSCCPIPGTSARPVMLEHLGFKALATTSAGMAWARPADGGVSLDEVLIHLAALAHATDLPLNADFENGFADAPKEVAANVALAIDTGIAGLSIEDSRALRRRGLYDFAWRWSGSRRPGRRSTIGDPGWCSPPGPRASGSAADRGPG